MCVYVYVCVYVSGGDWRGVEVSGGAQEGREDVWFVYRIKTMYYRCCFMVIIIQMHLRLTNVRPSFHYTVQRCTTLYYDVSLQLQQPLDARECIR